MRHIKYQGHPLAENVDAMLWGFPFELEEQDKNGDVQLLAEAKIEKRHGS